MATGSPYVFVNGTSPLETMQELTFKLVSEHLPPDSRRALSTVSKALYAAALRTVEAVFIDITSPDSWKLARKCPNLRTVCVYNGHDADSRAISCLDMLCHSVRDKPLRQFEGLVETRFNVFPLYADYVVKQPMRLTLKVLALHNVPADKMHLLLHNCPKLVRLEVHSWAPECPEVDVVGSITAAFAGRTCRGLAALRLFNRLPGWVGTFTNDVLPSGTMPLLYGVNQLHLHFDDLEDFPRYAWCSLPDVDELRVTCSNGRDAQKIARMLVSSLQDVDRWVKVVFEGFFGVHTRRDVELELEALALHA